MSPSPGASADAVRVLPVDVLLPALPPSVPRQGHPAWLRALGRGVMRVLGWRFVGGFADVPRQVIIGAPHTSNLDGLVGLAAAAACDIGVQVFAKRQLFWGPLGVTLRAFGGVPVDRDAPVGLVEHAAAALRPGRAGIVAITPEGTRSAVPRWKTGFHRIALAADVPIAIVAIDWGRKEIGVTGTLVPTGDLDADLAAIGHLLDGVQGRHPDRATLPA
ncbi:1-acyl-sn-glycerol-3-phosphate acyltransferase [Rubrivirga sp. SAORIC476]|uniref:1-acyl-sn-glycerol-3-phosphate acyltransferase n=1 Tax=Rubrivirga sp. SAORIC476 TaxID=1961794 RepID=UPI0018EA2FDA|nr:1-acyl-sn-glycerol-3-phosphate acyltransferase [Rubrivirga sp. SAORIC476]